MSKNLKVLYAIIICLLVIVTIAYIKMVFPTPVSKDRMEIEFSKYKDSLQSIAEYLEELEFTNIYITETDEKGEIFVSNDTMEIGKNIYILNDKISESIDDLFKKYHFNVIIKKENEVYFQRWSNRDYGWGVVFSIDGERPKNEFLTKLEPLNIEHWYFYEEK